MSTPLSILDLAPITEGSDAGRALHNSLDLARHAERWGYHRFWLAEHHGMPGVASAATAVVIGHVAAGTRTIRVGAGGIMLPNHAPLVIAEQFGTLASLYPGRIDLGLGRAPGSDPLTTRALRRTPGAADTFPQDVMELMSWFRAAGARTAGAGGAGRGPRRADLDPGLQPLWGGARRGAGTPLCVRFALRAGRDDRCARALPLPFPALRSAGTPLHDGRRQRLRRGYRRRGAAAFHLPPASLHQPAPRPPGATAPARRWAGRSDSLPPTAT